MEKEQTPIEPVAAAAGGAGPGRCAESAAGAQPRAAAAPPRGRSCVRLVGAGGRGGFWKLGGYLRRRACACVRACECVCVCA